MKSSIVTAVICIIIILIAVSMCLRGCGYNSMREQYKQKMEQSPNQTIRGGGMRYGK